MPSPKPIASLSLDLDNQWSYLKTHGDAGWEDLPSYFEIVVPRILNLLARRNLRITFFVVGQDAALKKNHQSLRAIAGEGHEIGNHSFSHEPWLHLYGDEQVQKEIETAEEQITAVTGQRPTGFRGPGFSLSECTIRTLESRGYLYDASTWPTYFGPLARAYYFLSSRLSGEERGKRSLLFGSLRQGLRSLKPYRWNGNHGLLEIPVTTLPILRAPVHVSYLLYLSAFSARTAVTYFRCAMALCRIAGVAPSLLLHPLDFLGNDDEVGLKFFPAMNLPKHQKIRFVREILDIYCDEFRVVALRDHALHALEQLRGSAENYYAANKQWNQTDP